MANYTSAHTGDEIDLSIASGSTTTGVIKDFTTLSGSATSTITTNNIVTQHITASGNISSSGIIIADTFQSTGGDVGGISFTDDLNITGNITASGDISASGDGYFSGINIDNGSASDPTINFIKGSSATGLLYDGTNFVLKREGSTALSIAVGNITFGGGGNSKISAVTNTSLTLRGGTTNTLFNTTGITTEGSISSSGAINTLSHITASGNISGSSTSTFTIGGNATIGGGNVGIVVMGDNVAGVMDGIAVRNDISASGTIYGGNVGSQVIIENGHITASGNISGSSTSTGSFGYGYFSDSVEIQNDAGELVLSSLSAPSTYFLKIQANYDSGNSVNFVGPSSKTFLQYDNGSNKSTIGVSATGITNIEGQYININSHITASGNISASGDLTANSINTPFASIDSAGVTSARSVFTFGTDSAHGQLQNSSTNGNITIKPGTTSGKVFILSPNQDALSITSGSFSVLGEGGGGHITASGNISASGNILTSGNITSIGTITGNTISLGNGENGFSSLSGGRMQISSSNDIFFDTGDDFLFKSEGTTIVQIKGDEAVLDVNGMLDVSSHITASGNLNVAGNISSSVTSTGSFGAIHTIGEGRFSGDTTLQVTAAASGSDSAVSLTKAANGGRTTIIPNLSADRIYTLPTPEEGLSIRLVNLPMVADSHDLIVSSSGDVFLHGGFTWESSGSNGNIFCDGDSNKHIKIDTPSSADLNFLGKDSTTWYVWGRTNTVTIPVCADDNT